MCPDPANHVDLRLLSTQWYAPPSINSPLIDLSPTRVWSKWVSHSPYLWWQYSMQNRVGYRGTTHDACLHNTCSFTAARAVHLLCVEAVSKP